MLDSDIKVGVRVKCVFNMQHLKPNTFGWIGTINNVWYDYNNNICFFDIKWDNGVNSNTSWSETSSFNLLSLSSDPLQIDGTISQISINSNCIIEMPCKICNRKNDLGVKKCWFCENIIG